MEIDKKIIKKLIETLEDLKKSLDKNGEQLDTSEIKPNDDNPSELIIAPVPSSTRLSSVSI